MDFKSILTKFTSIEAPVVTPAAPELPKAVQLNEDAQLRVLAGTTSYKAEAAKLTPVAEVFDKDAKVGDKKKTSSGGTAEKTKTGLKHTAGDRYSGKQAEKEDKKKDESIDPAAFKSKFDKMVEAKKAKPDFLDADKDGNKKEPMKKALKDKKVKEGFDDNAKPGDTFKTKTGTATKTATGVKHTRDKFEYDPGSDDKDDKKAKRTAKKSAVEEGKDEGKPGKNFAKIAKKAGEKYGSKEAGKRVAGAVRKKVLAKESRVVAESVEQRLSFKDMLIMVQESGGQQAIDPVDSALWQWATRVASSKVQESQKAEIFAAMIYERNGGVFEMYDVLSEDQK